MGLFSQKGKAIKQTPPITSMVMTLESPHSPLVDAASVRGIRMRATPARSSRRPKMSISSAKLLITCHLLLPLNGEGGRRPSFAAFLWFNSNDKARGIKATGRMIDQMPYPHLQPILFKMPSAMGGPIQTLSKYGISGIVETIALFKRSLVSAMKICCKI